MSVGSCKRTVIFPCDSLRPPARSEEQEPPVRLTQRRLFAMTAHQEGHQVLRALGSPAREALLLWKVLRQHVGHKVGRQLLLLLLTHRHLRRKLPGRSML